MLGVRCSTFKAFRPPAGVTAPVWRIFIRSFIRAAPLAKKTASLIKKETLKSEDQNTTKIGMDSHL